MVTEKQIAALRYMIFISRDGNELTKKLLAVLIEKSERFSREICTTLTEGNGFTPDEIGEMAGGVGRMHSCNRTTHINGLMDLMGVDRMFNFHYGHMTESGKFDTTGQFAGHLQYPTHTGNEPLRYTFWLARSFYPTDVDIVSVSRDEIEAVNLSKPGLYPELEEQKVA